MMTTSLIPCSMRKTSVLIVMVLLAACSREKPAAYDEVRPVRSIVVGAQSGTVSATYTGELKARYESRQGFRLAGRVAERMVDVGGRVKRGQALLRLDAAQEELGAQAAGSSVTAARHRVAQVRLDLDRLEKLAGQHFISQSGVDQKRLELAEAESQLQAASAQWQIERNQKDYTVLRADRDGVVSSIEAETGQVVAAGQTVITIAVEGEREVLVSVPESRVDELRLSKALEVTFWARPGKTYRGKLRELAPDVDSVSRTYPARVTVVDADETLRLGMTATVRVPDIDGQATTKIPLAAIYDRDGHPQVWVVAPDTSRVAARAVTLSGTQNDYVLVEKGLSRGEVVVTAGAHLLHAGQKVKLLPAAIEAGGAQ